MNRATQALANLALLLASGLVSLLLCEVGLRLFYPKWQHLAEAAFVRDPDHLRIPWGGSPYRFEHDAHWNEAGNRLAAVCLYRFLESELRLPKLSEADLQKALRRYYSAFEQSGSLAGPPAASLEAAVLREKYGEFYRLSASSPGSTSAGRMATTKIFGRRSMSFSRTAP